MPCLRISYHAKDRLPLLTGPVRAGYYSLRERYPDARILVRSGWVRGPHYDLCATLGEAAVDADIDMTPEREAIEEWIAVNPSSAPFTPEEHAASSHKLAALEGVSEPLVPLRPDNTVEAAEYRPPRLVDGHEALQDTYAEFFAMSAPLLLDLAELKSRNGSAATLVLAAMLAHTADQLDPHGIERGYLSLQAHADFFFANYDEGGGMRAYFDRVAEASIEPMRFAIEGRPAEAVDEELATLVSEIMDRWTAITAETKAAVKKVVDTDDSWFYYNPSAFRGNEAQADHREAFAKAGMEEREIKAGATLDGIFDSGAMDDEFFRSKEFQTYRVLINAFYSLLPVISVSPAERFGLCHLVTAAHLRSVDEAERVPA